MMICGCANETCRQYGCQADPKNQSKRTGVYSAVHCIQPIGWICPLCGAGVSPQVQTCKCKDGPISAVTLPAFKPAYPAR